MIAMRPVSEVCSGSKDTSHTYTGRFLDRTYHPAPLPAKLIQKPFELAMEKFTVNHTFPYSGRLSPEQVKAFKDITFCKTPDAGFTVYQCSECGYKSYNYNKCTNRNCPVCQNLKTLVWVDERSAEVIDASYYHLVMTLPHELNGLIYANQESLYGLLHKSLSSAIIELAMDEQYLGGVPGIIQVLHTWDQDMKYHVHVHAVISGAGLTKDNKLVYAKSDKYLVPEKAVSKLVKGKFLDALKTLYCDKSLRFVGESSKYVNYYEWKDLISSLYTKDWVCYIKETFNGNGNAIDYLARYTNKIAIGNNRIRQVTDDEVTFTVRGEDGTQSEERTLSIEDFVGRYLMHVLPSGFQKIRYYGFLANGCRKKKLALIFELQGRQQFLHRYKEPKESEVLRVEFHVDLDVCPQCGKKGTMSDIDEVFGMLSSTFIPLGQTKASRKAG